MCRKPKTLCYRYSIIRSDKLVLKSHYSKMMKNKKSYFVKGCEIPLQCFNKCVCDKSVCSLQCSVLTSLLPYTNLKSPTLKVSHTPDSISDVKTKNIKDVIWHVHIPEWDTLPYHLKSTNMKRSNLYNLKMYGTILDCFSFLNGQNKGF